MGTSHLGSIKAGKTGQVYDFLRNRAVPEGHRGGWVTGLEICQGCIVTAASTYVSQIRAQMPAGEALEVKQEGKVWSYRIVLAAPKGQADLFGSLVRYG